MLQSSATVCRCQPEQHGRHDVIRRGAKWSAENRTKLYILDLDNIQIVFSRRLQPSVACRRPTAGIYVRTAGRPTYCVEGTFIPT
jgi:hypothetical protein